MPERPQPRGRTRGARSRRDASAGPHEGDRFNGEVRDLTSVGLGVVAHPSGRVFFVAGVWPGERGNFEISSLKGRSGKARLLHLEHPSPERVDARCAHHGSTPDSCGGCPWQFMAYDAQLAAKQARVEKLLQPLVNSDDVIAPIWPSPESFAYRNRAQLKTDGQRLGYVAAGSRRIVDVQACPVLNAHNASTLAALRKRLPQRDWRPRRGRDFTTIDIDDDVDADSASIDARRPFRQGNTAQNARMRDWLRDRVRAETANRGERGAVLELFAGSGNFTEVLAEEGCKPVVAADSFEPAVAMLRDRMLPGVKALCVDLHRADVASLLQPALGEARLLLLDPPREGLRHCGAILDGAAVLETILYISCDAPTFARDAQAAQERGFTLQSLQPLDLFPQTPHVELLAVLRRGHP